MRIGIESPWLFCLLPLCMAVVLAGLNHLRIGGKGRKRTIVALRLLLLTALVGALAGITVSRVSDQTTTVFLIDASESFAGNREAAVEMTKNALKRLPKGEKAAVVAFGADAGVEQFVTDQNLFSGIDTNPVGTATNLEKAVQTALSLYPDDSAKRLVLITDGNENEGDLAKMSGTLNASRVDVHVVCEEDQIGAEVYLSKIEVPEKIRMGDTFTVRVEVESTVKTGAVLQLYGDNELKKQEKVWLQSGTNSFVFQDTRKKKGFANYRAVIQPDQDTVQINNEYVAYTEAEDGDRVLLIEGERKESREFQKVLKAANIAFDVVSPRQVPKTLNEMVKYASMILENVYLDDLPTGFQNLLNTYVKDYGGGLVATGGSQSFALGGYRDSVLEEVLPVKMDLSGEKEVPKLAMAMVIDQSGSMVDKASDKGAKTKLQMAKEAAAAAVDNLRDTDIVGVESFDDAFRWNVELQELSDREEVNGKIFGISEDGGGTSIYPALKEAFQKIRKTDAQLKHIILLTDGQDAYRGYDSLLQQIKKEGVTLSTVAIGGDADKKLMAMLAEKGGGRYYQTDNSGELSRIFAQEVYLSEKEYLVNREFTPVITSESEILQGTAGEGLPELKGYVAASLKENAEAVLMDDEKEDPILAAWQYGLGKTVAYTTDVTNEWSGNYAAWDQYPVFWKNIINWTVQNKDDQESRILAQQEGNAGRIIYQNTKVKPDAELTAVYTDSAGQQKEISLQSVSAGTYEGEIDLAETGVYSINIRRKENGEITESSNVQLTMQYSEEYRFEDNTDSLQQFMAETGAHREKDLQKIYRQKPEAAKTSVDISVWLMTAAAVLLLADIVLRRISLVYPGRNLRKVREKRQKSIRPIKQREAVRPTKQRKRDEQMLDVGTLLQKQKERERK